MTADDLPQVYNRPPIVEAVFELRFASALAEKRREKLRDRLVGGYDASTIEEQGEVKIDFPSQSATFERRGAIFKLMSFDLVEECIMKVDSIAWIRRAPYLGWQSFRSRFAPEMRVLFKLIDNPIVSRLGLRYVNRIDVRIVNNVAAYEDFLNFRIEHGEFLEPIAGFHWQLVKEFPEIGLKASVQSASLMQEIIGYGAFSFDIDVYSDAKIHGNLDEIFSKVNQMRDLKNKIFEAGITDKARRGYYNA